MAVVVVIVNISGRVLLVLPACAGAHLHAGDPGVGVGVLAVAVWAHVVLDDELDDKGLLQDGAVEDLALDGQLDLEALGVRLCPDEASIDQLDLR